jgi:hypothetical protein
LAFRGLERAFRWLDAKPLTTQIAVTGLLITLAVTVLALIVGRLLHV